MTDGKDGPAGSPQLSLAEQGLFDDWYRLLLLPIAVGGDVVMFKVIVGQTNQGLTDWAVWVLVAAFTVAAVGPMHFAGLAIHRMRTHRATPMRMLSVMLLFVCWLLLGVGAFYLRLTHDPGTGTGTAQRLAGLSGAAATAEAPAVATSDVVDADRPMALLFLFLFFATGAMSIWMAANPVPGRLALVARHRRLGRVDRQLRRDARRIGRDTRGDARRARRDGRRAVRRRWTQRFATWFWQSLRKRVRERERLRPLPQVERNAISERDAASERIGHLQRQIAAMAADLERDHDREAIQVAGAVGRARERKQMARIVLARHVGDPAGTSAIGHREPTGAGQP
jgi:hypothetical protein